MGRITQNDADYSVWNFVLLTQGLKGYSKSESSAKGGARRQGGSSSRCLCHEVTDGVDRSSSNWDTFYRCHALRILAVNIRDGNRISFVRDMVVLPDSNPVFVRFRIVIFEAVVTGLDDVVPEICSLDAKMVWHMFGRVV